MFMFWKLFESWIISPFLKVCSIAMFVSICCWDFFSDSLIKIDYVTEKVDLFQE